MTVANIPRKAGPYKWSSGSSYPFYFKVFQSSDVSVYTLTGVDEELLESGYTVSINADQNNNPGGSVVVNGECDSVTILSNVYFTQNARFENRGGFYPETLNECYDKLTILCQQLKEEISRSIKVPVTSTETEGEMLSRLLSLADIAGDFANRAKELHDEVAEMAEIVSQSRDGIDAIGSNIDAVTNVSENIESINVGAGNIDSISAVAADLNAQYVDSLDCGHITDAVSGVAVPSTGYIKAVYDMKDNIQRIVDNLDSILAAVASIQEIESVNYEQVAEEA